MIKHLLNHQLNVNINGQMLLENMMHLNIVSVGEIYAKQTASKLVMYNVLKVQKLIVTLQNIDNPLSLFETTAQKIVSSGYIRISQTPYIDLTAATPKKRKVVKKPQRCPLTFDFLEARADSERPSAIMHDLFTAPSTL